MLTINSLPTWMDQHIEHLININVFNDDTKTRSIAFSILKRLIDDGIKVYMNKWYDEQTQANIIELIFNKVILIEFGHAYNRLLHCTIGGYDYNYNHNHQILVFNSNDLMSNIFNI